MTGHRLRTDCLEFRRKLSGETLDLYDFWIYWKVTSSQITSNGYWRPQLPPSWSSVVPGLPRVPSHGIPWAPKGPLPWGPTSPHPTEAVDTIRMVVVWCILALLIVSGNLKCHLMVFKWFKWSPDEYSKNCHPNSPTPPHPPQIYRASNLYLVAIVSNGVFLMVPIQRYPFKSIWRQPMVSNGISWYLKLVLERPARVNKASTDGS